MAQDWRPYRATAALLGVALALNHWAGNGLWFYYTLLGLGAFLTLAGLVRAGRVSLARPAVWAVGVAACLHYVGGSLSGLHTAFGLNGAYYVFPWWDNVVHGLGSGAVAIAAYALVSVRLPGRAWSVAVAVALATTVGVLVELWEFAQFVFLGTVDQGFYTNTLLDLYYNVLGAAVGALGYDRFVNRRAPAGDTVPSPAGE